MDDRPGTGFFVHHDDVVYLITNRHVIDPGYADAKYVGTRLTGLSVRGFDACSRHGEHEATYCFDMPSFEYGMNDDDVAVVSASTATACEAQPCPISNFYESALLARGEEFESTDRSESILAGDVVVVCGFPELDGHSQQERPMAMIGFISSDPRHRPQPLPNLSGGGPIRSTSVVLYQGFSRAGASGSPILAVQRGLVLGPGMSGPPSRPTRLVGINAGRVGGSPANPSALSYFVRSDAIIEAIERAAAAV